MGQEKEEIETEFWWAEEEMDKEIGAKKGKMWRESKKLNTRPDPVNKSTEDPYVEYCVPKSWTKYAKRTRTRQEDKINEGAINTRTKEIR